MNLRGFASDNNAGVHPEIMQAMADVTSDMPSRMVMIRILNR